MSLFWTISKLFTKKKKKTVSGTNRNQNTTDELIFFNIILNII